MAGTVIDSLVVTMGLDPSDFQRGSKQVEQGVKALSQKMPTDIQHGVDKMASALSGGLKTVLTSFVGPLTAALGGMAAIKQYTAQADAIGKLSASIGVNAEAMQAWGEAAARAGGSADAFYSTLGTLNKVVQTIGATGNGRGKDVLDALGISVKGKDGRVRESFEILQDLASAAQRVGNVKFQGLAQRLGLDQGTIMLLQSGREAVDELVERQRSLGGYTAEDMEATAAYNDAVADLQQSLKALGAVFLRYIIPPMARVMNAITTVVVTLRKHKAVVVTILAGIGAALKTQVIAGVVALGTAIKGLMASLAPMIPLIAAVSGIALVMDDLVTWLNGGKAALSGFWEMIFGKPEQARAEIEAAWNSIKTTVMGLWESINTFASDVFEALTPLRSAFDPIAEAVGKLGDLFKAVGDLIGTLFNDVLLAPIQAFFSLISSGTSDADGGFSMLEAVVQSVADALSLAAGAVGLVIDAFKAGIEWITAGVKKLKEFGDYVGTLDLSKLFSVPSDWGEALLQPLRDVKAWFDSFSITDILKGWGTAIAEWWSGLVDMIYAKLYDMMPDWVKKLLGYFGVSVGGKAETPAPPPAVSGAFPTGPAAEVPTATVTASGAASVSNNRETNVNVGTVTINSQATDAEGIAGDFADEMSAAVEAVGGGVLD